MSRLYFTIFNANSIRTCSTVLYFLYVFRIDFIVTNMPLRIVLEISVDLADVDNVNYDTVRMRELRNLPFVKPIMKSIKNCPKGLSFLPSFCNQVEAHVRKCEEEKKQTTKIL